MPRQVNRHTTSIPRRSLNLYMESDIRQWRAESAPALPLSSRCPRLQINNHHLSCPTEWELLVDIPSIDLYLDLRQTQARTMTTLGTRMAQKLALCRTGMSLATMI